MNDFLYAYSSDVYSDNGEDGINKVILDHLGITEGVVLEIGAWDGFLSSNCANLWSKNNKFNAVLIESTNRLNKNLEKQYDNIACFVELVSLDNSLEDIITKSKFEVTNDNFVLASIDVDGDDINVTKSLGKYKPIILIVEPNGNVIEKYNPNGATVKELVDFGDDLGYEFIGMSGYPGKHSGNVYFIRKDYKDKFDICKKSWDKRGILLPEGVVY